MEVNKMLTVYCIIYIFLLVLYSLLVSYTTNMLNTVLFDFTVSLLIIYCALLYLKNGISYLTLTLSFLIDKARIKKLHTLLFRKVVMNTSATSYGDMLVILKEDSNNYVSYKSLLWECVGYVICFFVCSFNLFNQIGVLETCLCVVIFLIFYYISETISRKATDIQEKYIQSLANSLNVLTELFENRIWMNSMNRKNYRNRYVGALTSEVNSLHNYYSYKDTAKAINSIAILVISFVVCIFMLLNHKLDSSTVMATFVFVDTIGYQIKYIFDSVNEMKPLLYSVKKINSKLKESIVEETLNGFDYLEFDNITLTYDKVIFDNTYMKVEYGKKYLIIGNNGTGKSSLLKCLYFLLNFKLSN